MTKFTVKKGNYFCSPRRFKFWLSPIGKTFTWKIKFDPNCKYILPGEDQWDWNKIGGIDLDSPFSTMTNSIMGGWRYNPTIEKIELNAYFHNGKGVENRIMSEPLCFVDTNQEVTLKILVGEDIWQVHYWSDPYGTMINHGIKSIKPKKASALFATEIQFYFGGNQQAPQDVSIYKELI